MLTTLLSYLPIVAAPVAAVGLAIGLQHWLKSPRTAPASATPSTATDLVAAPADGLRKTRWEDIATHTHPLVAYVLPTLSSAAVVLLGLWPFAYLGRVIIRLDPDPGWGDQVPPWFGNLGYFLGFGFAGVITAIAGAVIVTGLVVGLHALGKCILWPGVCCGTEVARTGADDDPRRCADNDHRESG